MTDNNNKIGRPTDYNKDIADRICLLLAEGSSLRAVCLLEDMPEKATIFRWLYIHPEFSDQYARATTARAEAKADKLDELGEEAIATAQTTGEKRAGAVVQAYKLKADNLKWTMAREKPKKYGDKIDMTTDGKAITVELINYKKPTDTDNKGQN